MSIAPLPNIRVTVAGEARLRAGRGRLLNSIDGEPAGCGVRTDAIALCALEDLVHGVTDSGEPGVELRPRPVQFLDPTAMEHTTGVDHEVRRVRDAALPQQIRVAG